MKNLIQEIKIEYRKVVWPSKNSIISSTLLVAIMSIVVSIYISAFDMGASKILHKMVNLFGG